MGLEVVLNQILENGKAEEAKILQKAEAERNQVLGQARSRANDTIERRKAQTQRKLEALRREVMSAAEFEVRRRLLVARRELQEDFRRRVSEALADLPANRNKALLATLYEHARKELPKGTVNARAADFATLAKNGYSKGHELATTGGFQVESSDATIVLDFRFDTLLENAWKDIVSQNEALFEG